MAALVVQLQPEQVKEPADLFVGQKQVLEPQAGPQHSQEFPTNDKPDAASVSICMQCFAPVMIETEEA
jgi:hypothetical protein